MRLKCAISFYLTTFCCFIDKRWFVNKLVDFYPQYQTLEQKNQLKNTILDQRRELIGALSKAFFLIVSAGIIAFSFCLVSIPIIWSKLLTYSKICGIISVFCFSFSTLAQLNIQELTAAGDLPFEKLNKGILWAMYFLGALLGTISFLT